MANEQFYDCVIVGGGPAGLSCALMLARACRRVLVISAGPPRNAASHGIHGLIGHDGISPAELLRRGREAAGQAGAEFWDAKATRIERLNDGFRVETDKRSSAFGRRVVLAHGLHDHKPDIPDFDRYYGHSIFHCPDCDAYETRGQSVGVIGWEKKAPGVTLLLRQWTDRLMVLTHGHPPEFPLDVQAKLDAQSIPVRTERIVELMGVGRELEAVVLESGERLPIRFLFFSLGLQCPSGLIEGLGCEPDEIQPHLKVNSHRETTIPGVYAIGDLVAGSQMVATAAADGIVAAIAINKSLYPPEWIV